jgi:hypothetical protein
MKLKRINEENADEIFNAAVGKYTKAKGQGNINKKQSENNPDKTEQPYEPGNQNTPATNDQDKLKLLGAADNSHDKQKPSNITH